MTSAICTLCELVTMSDEVGPRVPLAVAITKGCAVGKSGVFAWKGFVLCDDCTTLLQRVAEGHNAQVDRQQS